MDNVFIERLWRSKTTTTSAHTRHSGISPPWPTRKSAPTYDIRESKRGRVLVTGAPQLTIRPERIEEEMAALFTWIKSSPLHPVILAGEAHYKFVKIHPFYDGNGRTARLLMNWSLLSSAYPLTVIPAEARARYITSIDDADRGRPLEFFQLLCECVESSLDQYLMK